jgi:hypothetical protein
MEDPRRAVGRQDDVRIDAQLIGETVTPGQVVGVTYQITNLTTHPIAVAERVCDVSFDSDSRTITVGLGSEVPHDGLLPRMIVIPPGQQKTLSGGGTLRVAAPTTRSALAVVPQFVQIKVTILRDLTVFTDLISKQAAAAQPMALSDAQFERWLESSDTIFLNPIPVRFEPKARNAVPDAEHGMSVR